MFGAKEIMPNFAAVSRKHLLNNTFQWGSVKETRANTRVAKWGRL